MAANLFAHLMPPFKALVVLGFLLFPHFAFADTEKGISGRVIAVKDGDTVHVVTAKQQLVKIRLAEIDAPELKQPYGQKSKQALSDLCFGKDIVAVVVDMDRYGRKVAHLYYRDIDINAEMVRQGMAWAYPKYLRSDTMINMQRLAQAEGKGLWALQEDQRVAPWVWRKKN